MPPFNQVTDQLFQGSVPDPGSSYDNFSMIVLCAEERQPELPRFRGHILRPAFSDTPDPSKAEIDRARRAASEVGTELMRGGRVLVTCAAGLNRSGLVTGFALIMTTRLSPIDIIKGIRAARGDLALSNPTFAKMVFSAADIRDRVLAGVDDAAKQARGRAPTSRGPGRGR